MKNIGRKLLFAARVIQTIGTIAREARNMHFAVRDYRYYSQRDNYYDREHGRRLPTNPRPPNPRRRAQTRRDRYDHERLLRDDGLPPDDTGDFPGDS
jgi:hypothetical protein